MLQKIDIQNYQSLEKVEFDLGRVTVIVGETGRGKSALVRALFGLVENQSGDFVTYGKTDAIVSVKADNNDVSWIKGHSNSYKLNGELYDKVGRGCPSEISDIIRMGVVDVGDVKFMPNFHLEFAPPFLLTRSDSGSKIAKILGFVTNANLLFGSSKICRSNIRQKRELLKVREGDYRQVVEDIKQYDDLPQLIDKLDSLNKAFTLIKSKESALHIEKEFIVDYRDKERDLTEADLNVRNSRKNVDAYKEIKEVNVDWYRELFDFLQVIRKVSKDFEDSSSAAQTSVEKVEALEPIVDVGGTYKELQDMLVVLNNIKKLNKDFKSTELEYTNSMVVSNQAEDDLKAFETEHPNCPLCGHLLKEN